MIITLVTDFGSPYVGIVKGVIKTIVPNVDIIEISSDIPPFDIKSGAFVLYSSYKFFPKETIHVAVVDPGVGSERKAIAIKTKNYYFIGPDNGILIPAAKDDGIIEIREIKVSLPYVSSTFHGRDIFAPAAAFLAKERNFEKIGNKINNFNDLEFFKIIHKDNIECEIVFIDRFGNLVLSIEEKDIDLSNCKLLLEKDNKLYELKYVKTYAYANKGELIILKGSSNFYEISIREGSAKDFLKVSVGDKIKLKVM
ncbi:MAG: SAM-dependent chlorinase/fluorinase [Candidatus Verstraetearchaeota archaeon]|jgi:S-adenosylmethionine hydrolase|nr:SAM-dependent chlorinase/fluorinase [Candidatus Verstraetearchaeota archaeon]